MPTQRCNGLKQPLGEDSPRSASTSTVQSERHHLSEMAQQRFPLRFPGRQLRGFQHFPGHGDLHPAAIPDAHRQHGEPWSEGGRLPGQRALLAAPAFHDPGQPRRWQVSRSRIAAAARVHLRRPAASRYRSRAAVPRSVENFSFTSGAQAQATTVNEHDRRDDPAEAPQGQTGGHRLAQMRKPLGTNVVPLVKSRKARQGFSPVNRNACHISFYRCRGSPLWAWFK